MTPLAADPPPRLEDQPDRPTPAVLLRLGALFLASRVLVLTIAALSRLSVVPGPWSQGYANRSWLGRFLVWDTGWYLDVAKLGYDYNPAGASRIGFYPLYPLLIRVWSTAGLDPVLGGYLISHLALAGACVLCWRLAVLEFGCAATAYRAVTFMLFCPGAVWFGMIHSESLFILTMLGCMLAARQGRWVSAGAWGFASALSRTPGVLLAGFVALELIQQWWGFRHRPEEPAGGGLFPRVRRLWRPALAVAGPVLGQLGFMLFQQVRFGDWRAQQKTAASGWGVQGIRSPWINLWNRWHEADWFHTVLADSLLGLVVVVGLVSFPVTKRISYGGLILALAVLYSSSTLIDPLPRYLSTTIPVYLVLAQLASKSSALESTILVYSTALLTLLTLLLVNGYLMG